MELTRQQEIIEELLESENLKSENLKQDGMPSHSKMAWKNKNLSIRKNMTITTVTLEEKLPSMKMLP